MNNIYYKIIYFTFALAGFSAFPSSEKSTLNQNTFAILHYSTPGFLLHTKQIKLY